MQYETDAVLGEHYYDSFTGLEGTATAVTFYAHGCERVSLEFTKDGELKTEAFDAPRLRRTQDGRALTTDMTGGPGGREARRPNPVPRRS